MTLSVTNVVFRIMSFINAQRWVNSISDMHLPVVFVLYCIHKNFSVPSSSFINFTPDSKNDKLHNDLSEASRRNLPRTCLSNLYSYCYGLCSENRDFFDNNYVSILLELNKAVSSSAGLNGGIIFTPDEISSLMAYFIVKEGCQSIYDPFCGTANIINYLRGLKENISFEGQDINPNISLLARVVVEACTGVDTGIKCTDSINDWNEKHFDAVCSCPPFGLKIPCDPILEEEFCTSHVILEKLIIDRAIRYNSAKVVILLEPKGFANSEGRERYIRERLIESNLLDTIIALPSGLLYGTNIPCLMMVCKVNREDGQPITFIDASDNYTKDDRRERVLDTKAVLNLVQHPDSDKCIQVNRDEIREFGYILSPSSYITSNFEDFPKGYQVVDLKSLVELIPQNRKYSEKEGRFVSISQLSYDATECERAPESFELSSDLKNAYKLEEPALLLSTIGKLKVAYCIASVESPLFIHPHVRAFRLKEDWVNPAYLCLQISKSKGYNVGTIVPHINLSEILRIRVAFPSIGTQQSYDEQGHLYNEAVESAKLAKAKEIGLQKVIDKMKSEYMIEVRNRKHDMKTPMTQLRNTLTLLDAFAKDLPVEQSQKLQSYINRQRVAVDTLSEIVRHLADEEIYSQPEVLNIEEILLSMVEDNERYSIEFHIDEVAFFESGLSMPLVYVGKSDFLRLVNNIVGNAIEHGFLDKSMHYRLYISLSVEDGSYSIRFINNGMPLPEGMDKDRYGMKGVKGKDSKGQGTGGNVVKNITEHYGGEYDVYTKVVGDETLTVIDVKLPIYQADE